MEIIIATFMALIIAFGNIAYQTILTDKDIRR